LGGVLIAPTAAKGSLTRYRPGWTGEAPPVRWRLAVNDHCWLVPPLAAHWPSRVPPVVQQLGTSTRPVLRMLVMV
jgi:hypothetical protein